MAPCRSGLALMRFPGMLRGVVTTIPVEPSLEAFVELAKRGNVVPVYTQLAADFETPLSAYLKLRDSRHSFLLESAESTEKGGRWSIVGSKFLEFIGAFMRQLLSLDTWRASRIPCWTPPTTIGQRGNLHRRRSL